MAITSLRLKNFRCFSDSGTIPIAPLTVIFGRNNTGKSSILRSLLLLRQTLDTAMLGPRLNLRGPLYRAGTYADIVHQHRVRDHITMQFGLAKNDKKATLTLEFASDAPNQPPLNKLSLAGDFPKKLEIRRGPGRGGPYHLWIGNSNRGNDEKSNFFFGVNQFLPLIGDEPIRPGRPSPEREETRRSARSFLAEFQKSLRGIKAVGAFRDEPKRQYEYQGHPSETVDLRGRNVVHALIEAVTQRRKAGKELFGSVNRWLQQVGRVALQRPKKLSNSPRLYELRLKDTDSGRWASFADVGFGIGQALSVIVEGLRTPVGGTFIVEEPEIHLHPDAQLAMGDFLVSLAMTGRNVIAETHSEPILLRIRRSILSGSKQNRRKLKPQDVSILYVDKGRDGASRVRSLDLDDFGQVKNWPKGFMEEVTEERMQIMHNMAKQAKSKK